MINPHLEFQFDEVLAISETKDSWKLNWRVPSKLIYFDGHFPQNPILPAVGVIDGSLELIKKVKKESLDLEKVKKAKFLGLITPGLNLEIILNRLEKNHWRCRWNTPEKLMAEVDLILRG